MSNVWMFFGGLIMAAGAFGYMFGVWVGERRKEKGD